MPRVRPINAKKYMISKRAFQTAYFYCLQYPEWKQRLRELQPAARSQRLGSSKGGSSSGDSVSALAIERAEISSKIDNVESAIREACGSDKGMRKYLLEYVTQDGMTYERIRARGAPCGQTYFYALRRRFYAIIAKRI